MAEASTLKRLRDETQVLEQEEEMKRYKSSSSSSSDSGSYNQILSFLEAEEEEPVEDLSSLITSLQQELSSSSTTSSGPNDNQLPELNPLSENPSLCLEESSSSSTEDEEDKERVIRHLLEASDDELGIPEIRVDTEEDDDRNGFSLYDGLWEFEDEAANYYTLLQSELFMEPSF